jgi:hypothetical protein
MARLASALLLTVCLAGCGGTSDNASSPPAKAAKLTAGQQDTVIAAVKDFAAATSSFFSDLDGCGPGNPTCIRAAFDSFKTGADKTDRDIAALQATVSGGCATSLDDARGQVREGVGLIRDIADAGSRGDQAAVSDLIKGGSITGPLGAAVRHERTACT